MRKEQSFNKLWDDISLFNREMGVQAAGHLEFFLKRFQKELDEFVAEFERVPRQIGAIILVDDQVVGIERAPSHAYWQSVWPCLIRECYGSLAIRAAQLKGEGAEAPPSRTPLPEGIGSLDELELVIAEIAREEDDRAKGTVRELLDEPLKFITDESTAGLSIETVQSGRFTGQVIRDGERIVYDASDGITGNNTGGMPAALGVKGGHAKSPPHFIDNEDPKRTRTVTDRAISFMQSQAKAKRPFYIQISYYAQHLSVVCQQKTLAKYEAKGAPDRGYTPAWAAMMEELDQGVALATIGRKNESAGIRTRKLTPEPNPIFQTSGKSSPLGLLLRSWLRSLSQRRSVSV